MKSPNRNSRSIAVRALPHAFRLLGVVLFVAILSKIEIGKLLQTLKASNSSLIALSLLLSAAIIFVKSLRWHCLIEQQNIRIFFLQTLKIYCVGNYFGIISPARFGEFAKMFYVKTRSLMFSSAGCIITIVADRFIDIVTILLVVILGTVIIFHKYLATTITATILICFGALLAYHYRYFLVSKLVGLVNGISAKFNNSTSINREEIVARFRVLKGVGLKKVILYNILAWLLFCILIYMIAIACNINIGFFYLVASVSCAMLFSMLPITIAGVGVRDAVLIYAFSKAGISSEQAVMYSLMYLCVCLIFPALVGFVIYMFKPVDIRMRPRSV